MATKKKIEPIAEMPPPEDKDKTPEQAAGDAAASITMTTDELAKSTHPLAPKHPLKAPDAVPPEETETK